MSAPLLPLLKLGASLSAGVLNATPLQDAYSISMVRGVGSRSPIPFVMVALNGLVWTVYGVIVRNWIPLVLANSIGFMSGVIGLVTFRAYAKDSLSGTLLTTLTAVVFLVFGTTQYVVVDPPLYPATQDLYGKFCVSVTIFMYASPLVAVKEVLRTGSSSALSKPMTIASFCCSSLWFAYGVVIDDVNVWFPNVAGLSLSLVQIGLLIRYPTQHYPHHRGNGAGLV